MEEKEGKKKDKQQEKKKFSLTQSFLAANLTVKLITAAAVVAVLIFIGVGIGKSFSAESKTTKLGFEDIGELATQAAYCTEVNVTEASRSLWGMEIPFTQSKYIYSYDVEIKAGMDFSAIEWNIDEKNSVITVKLPAIKVLSNEPDLDSLKIYHEEESIFRQISLEENNEALAALKETAEKDAVANGLLENARANAETILTTFFGSAYDLDEYKLQFTDLKTGEKDS